LPGGVGLHTSTGGAAAVSRSEDGASECRYVIVFLMFIHLNLE